MTVQARFDRFVDKSGDCWIWTGATTSMGYGSFGFKGKVRSAHRVAWELATGRELPTGICVCHRCDNPKCVNVAHLFLGTQRDNMADAARKGRMAQPTGEASPFAKVTDLQVQEMRFLRGQGWLLKHLAARYGLGITQVHRIVNGGSRT